MKTVADILKISTEFLAQKGIVSPRRQVEELLSHVLKIPRIEIYMQFDRPIIDAELDQLRAYLKLSAQKMPWQYIIGEVHFLGCTIEVTQDVLIPRLETEILADMVIKELPQRPVVVWDICCGSGYLGVVIKKKRPDCTVVLSDLSPKAVEVAKRNAVRNEVDVDIRIGDLCSPFQGEKADIVVCNPPYVTEEEYSKLEPEVRDWEPKMALVGDLYERLAQELPPLLNPNSMIYLEMGTGMGNKLKTLFSHLGPVEILKDWAGHDRFLKSKIF
jgi:release factor glutamine methyltransferase